MNMLATYSEIGAYSEVLGASQHRQIELLLEKLLAHLKQAVTAINTQAIVKKCKCISSANNIVIYLGECLNHEADPKLAQKLDGIYRHLEKQLFTANSSNNALILNECIEITENLLQWWKNVDA